MRCGRWEIGVSVMQCKGFVLLVCGGEQVFGRVGCPFVGVCCPKVFAVCCLVWYVRVGWG